MEPGFIIIKGGGNFFTEAAPAVQKHGRGDADTIQTSRSPAHVEPSPRAGTHLHALPQARANARSSPKNTLSPLPPRPTLLTGSVPWAQSPGTDSLLSALPITRSRRPRPTPACQPGGHGPAVRHGKPRAGDTVPKTHVRDELSQGPPRTPGSREGRPLWAGGGGIVRVLQGLSDCCGPGSHPRDQREPGRPLPAQRAGELRPAQPRHAQAPPPGLATPPAPHTPAARMRTAPADKRTRIFSRELTESHNKRKSPSLVDLPERREPCSCPEPTVLLTPRPPASPAPSPQNKASRS